MNRRCPTGLRAAGCRCGAGRRRGRRRRRGGRGRGGSGRVATGAAAASGLVRQVVDTNTTAKLLGELDDICERKKKKKKKKKKESVGPKETERDCVCRTFCLVHCALVLKTAGDTHQELLVLAGTLGIKVLAVVGGTTSPAIFLYSDIPVSE